MLTSFTSVVPSLHSHMYNKCQLTPKKGWKLKTQIYRGPFLKMTDVFWGKEFMMKIFLFGHSRTNMLDTPVFIPDLQGAVLDTLLFF